MPTFTSRLAEGLNRHFQHSSVPMETFNAVWDIWWAIWILAFGSLSLPSTEYHYLSLVFPDLWYIAVPTVLLGLTQLWSVYWGSRSTRCYLALLSATAWIAILSLIIAANGPITGSYVVNYGMAALGEIWVFLRLTRPWK